MLEKDKRVKFITSTLLAFTAVGTLIHEAAHAKSGAADATEEFEAQLTAWLGKLAVALASRKRVATVRMRAPSNPQEIPPAVDAAAPENCVVS